MACPPALISNPIHLILSSRESGGEEASVDVTVTMTKVCWAIGEDQKRPSKTKIIDQEHAAELLALANDYLA